VRFLDKILIDRAIIECFEHFHDRRPIKITALTAGNDFVLLFEELGDAAGQSGVEPMGEGECLQGPAITEIKFVAIGCSLHDETATVDVVDINATPL
jgi:hypothetical protein